MKKQTTIEEELDKQIRAMFASSAMLSQTMAGKLGINSTDLECMDYLYTHEDATAGELAVLTGLTTGAITAAIDRLEKKGFVKRIADKNDRRKIIVALNREKAQTLISPLYLSLSNEMHKLYKRFTDTQLETLLAFTTKAREVTVKEITKLKEN